MRPTDVTTAHLARETDRVLATAERLRDDEIAAPSLCTGWSRGHVLAHLARNADALGRVCDAALTGAAVTMYAGDDVRDAEIDAGAARSARELAEDLRLSAERLAPQAARIGPEHEGMTVERTPGGARIPVEKVPYLRLRELVFHHVDLDAGYAFSDVDPEVLELLLDDAVARLRSSDVPPSMTVRTDEGDSHVLGEGSVTVTGPRAAVLLWLARGRTGGVHADADLPRLPFGG
ncbi:hypothetical protein N865_08280 [Intrasporangium oryzae NRRL B-24470]|uniref:Mycothiol-dependent maleylpyruvate isomerase metal-binding domain-containing protein n=1 Tax=Intrasporangium oryzae NRRL B-24470 TaxID=1386089 RepID=W9G6M7_9MICO|nr:maleylpyruvate isomerase family mycothiol-dependent enzyme [Intrasporangium oryzae]EWT01846.1 hypothetical protein N865_08280 [Intrasporangium oryzae NRRL B-24470]